MEYSKALENFLELLTKRNGAYYSEQYPHLPKPTYSVNSGKKYDRIVSDGWAFCFINKSNGDILKAASWKAPAKHARGNIFNENPLLGTTVYGATYL